MIFENLNNWCNDVKPSKPYKVANWSPPLNESLNFNVDGLTRTEEGCAGIGGVLRNLKGGVLCSFSVFIGNSEAISSKVWAIHKAYSLCMSKPSLLGRNIQILSDSRLAVDWVNKEDFGNLNLVNTIYDIHFSSEL